MPEIIDIARVICGLVLLYYGAEWLVRAASEIAIRFGISPLVVGLTIVAFGTSAPELVVSVKANFQGNGGMAIGNVVGSNICNIALVLGMGALIYPIAIQKQVIRREMPILLTASVLFLFMMRDGLLGQLEAAVLFLGIILYVVTSLVAAKKEDPDSSEEIPPEVVEAARDAGKGRLFFNLFLVLLGALTLVIGADQMVVGGENIAHFYHVPEAIIGLTLFAFGTSLPELATSVVAALKKQGDLIVGNAIGSCIFNLLAVLGLAGVISPLEGVGVFGLHYGVMLAVTCVLMPMMWQRMKLDRWEGGLLVIGYFAFTAYLVFAR